MQTRHHNDEAFQPHADIPDAWIDDSKSQIGYEISFIRRFYKPTPLRSLDEIRAELAALREEGDGLLEKIIGMEALPPTTA